MAAGEEDNWLIIFDCDGVLVDSEPIALAVLQEMLEAEGLELPLDEVADRFLGRSLSVVTSVLDHEFSLQLGDDFYKRMRKRLFERFEANLVSVSGIEGTLDALSAAGFSFCVASSSLPDRIEKSLSITRLIDRFSPRIFSASMVPRGKPAPDLFFYAAAALGFSPERCLVVEDSPAGIEAARAAGMHVFAFTGGSHTSGEGYMNAMRALEPDARFDAMGELLQLVDQVRKSENTPHA